MRLALHHVSIVRRRITGANTRLSRVRQESRIEYDIVATTSGLHLYVSGYIQRIGTVFQEIIKRMSKLASDEVMFRRILGLRKLGHLDSRD